MTNQMFLFKNQTTSPLADRMRPQNLNDFVGQEHIVGKEQFFSFNAVFNGIKEVREIVDRAKPLVSLCLRGRAKKNSR